ncbi:LiaF domain-containing protein [Lapidilactobacillus bayanensis]|uniref:LiaF domain-containing protein n=1 Tax=Lapidilactobacillus bayanensis TaxID=2485998 RepID=UPI000F7B7082|nr:LiaF domain-containing protein [Lapidilactobacillus bayanensis]
MNNQKNYTNILIGLGILALTVVLILQKLDLITVIIFPDFWTLGLTLLFGVFCLRSLLHLDLDGLLFSGALLINLYKQPLGIGHWSLWYLLGIALLLDIGLSLSLKPWLKKKGHWQITTRLSQTNHDSFVESTTANHDDELVLNLKISDATRYIRSDNFRSAQITMWIGEVKLYLDEATIIDSAQISFDGGIGEIELYVPKTWQVVNQVSTTIGEVNDDGEQAAVTGPILYLVGHLQIGEITIHYI